MGYAYFKTKQHESLGSFISCYNMGVAIWFRRCLDASGVSKLEMQEARSFVPKMITNQEASGGVFTPPGSKYVKVLFLRVQKPLFRTDVTNVAPWLHSPSWKVCCVNLYICHIASQHTQHTAIRLSSLSQGCHCGSAELRHCGSVMNHIHL